MSDDPTQSTPIAPSAEPAVEPVRPIVTAPRRSSSGRWLNVLLGVAAAVAIGGVAFAVGRSSAPVNAAGFGRVPPTARSSAARSTRTPRSPPVAAATARCSGRVG